LDITKLQAVEDFINANQVSVIINAAAYTAVDKAEEEVETAIRINGEAVGNLAKAAKAAGALLVHVSTDYVFDGIAHQPIGESQKPNPISAYAHSKLLGEQLMLEAAGCGAIVRTSWLYSEYGHNFVKSMIKFGNERDELRVVYDQIGTPTYSGDLARFILQTIPQWQKLNGSEIFHYSNEGVTSWYDFALAIHELSGIQCRVVPIPSKDYPLPAARPFYSLMAKEKVKQIYGVDIPHWRESLKKCIARLQP
jgi:dTDP-4-dehydrorhamnose reductase